ncbi:MAG: HD domain-containing protein [Methanoregula sp.]|jgi:hypothetical protein
MNTFEKYKIHDAIHKTIGLSQLELDIIDTKSFQRLRNVKQLSLLSYVFPSADYSRFSHSLGTCYLSGKIFDALHFDGDLNRSDRIKHQKQKQKVRLAGLLHDIGHYPFSHVMEDAIKFYLHEYHPQQGLQEINSPNTEGPYTALGYLEHESVGIKILERDKQIPAILKKAKYSPTEISELMIRKGESPSELPKLISSDLDSDRLDYLLRDAYHIGLPYGSTDLNYILREFYDDGSGEICINSKALRTVDHFLLCRYFDYSQVIFHKTSAGLEEVLKRVIAFLIERGEIKISPDHIESMIDSGDWFFYDDIYLYNLIRKLYKDEGISKHQKLFVNSIIERNPPKEIAKLEYIDDIDTRKQRLFKSRISDLNSIIPLIGEKFDIDPQNIFVWDNKGLRLTKTGRMLEAYSEESNSKDVLNQSVRIYDRVSEKSDMIMNREDSLMNILSNKALYSIRLFILANPGEIKDDEIKKIRTFVYKNLEYRDWK